jgi:two-component system NarL family response regulator
MVLSEDRLFANAVEMLVSRQEDLRVIAVSESAEAPDVVMIEAAWSGGKALQRTAAIRSALASSQVIVFGLEQEDESVIDFIEAGAVAYVLKSAPPHDLLAAVRAAARGEAAGSPWIVASVLERIRGMAPRREPPAGSIPQRLTERELEVLRLLAAGLQNKEIGRELQITVQTVKNHVHSLLEKLEVHNRRAAVRRAFELNLVDLF